ncbi:MAG: ABC transporter permease [Actinobacteria bacterium]|nr:ABC transporter permease [Actinomycetota bacterium]
MRAAKRGLRSFRRHPGRNAVIVILLFVCLTFSISMLAVKLAADAQVQAVKERTGNYGEVRVSSDYMMGVFQEERARSAVERTQESRSMSEEERRLKVADSLVPEDVTDRFSRDPHILTYDKVLNAQIVLPGMKNAELESVMSLIESQAQESGPFAITEETFFFEGNTNGASASDFTQGRKKLIEGNLFTYKDQESGNPVVVVEKNFAEENELRVGDTLKAEISEISGEGGTLELEVVGIYESVEAERDSGAMGGMLGSFNPAGNKVFAPLSIVQRLNDTAGYVDLGSYYFDNVESTGAVVSAFEKEVGEGDKYEFVTDKADYVLISDPLLKVGNSSMIGLAGALGACVLIIILAMVITISGRSRDIGVLKALGATDRQVMLQYAVEVVCICLLAIVLAVIATAVISQPMGDWLLSGRQEVEEVEESSDGMGGIMSMMDRGLYKEGGYFKGFLGEKEKESSSLNVVFKGSLLWYTMAILIGISLLGMAVPVIWISRLRPARVLSME